MKDKIAIDEVWKDIKDYNGLYQISNLGNIYSYKTNKILKNAKSGDGYLTIQLCKNGIIKTNKVHRLVANSFINNKNRYKEVNHIDGNKHNNNVSNLEWCNRSQNEIHAYKNGLAKGSNKNKLAKDNKRAKKVIQYNLDGIEIKKYDGIREASRLTNTNCGHIVSCCKKRLKSIGGYIWRYNND